MGLPKQSGSRRKFNREPINIDDLTSASSFSGIRDVIESHFGRPHPSGHVTEPPGPEARVAPGPAAPDIIGTDPTRLQYAWAPKAAPISVRLNAELIDRLERESLEIFRAVTHRGSEIGGVLLGHVLPGKPPAVVVEDYEPAACAYSLGPAFLLSDEEQRSLKEAVARRKRAGDFRVVGFFRSNTRPTLVMQEEDLALFGELFPDEHNIFLLVKPFSRRPCEAAIFVREGNEIRSGSSYLEFPFSRSELEKRGELQPAIRVSGQPDRAAAVSASPGGGVTILPPTAAPSEPERPKPMARVGLEPFEKAAIPAALGTKAAPASGARAPEFSAPVSRSEPPSLPEVKAKAPVPPRIETKIGAQVEARAETKIEPKIGPAPSTSSPRQQAPDPFRYRRGPVQPDAASTEPGAPASSREALPPRAAASEARIELKMQAQPGVGDEAAPRSKLRWLLPAAAAVLVAVIAVFALLHPGRFVRAPAMPARSGNASNAPKVTAPIAAPAPASAPQPQPATLVLRVEGSKLGLIVRWDGSAAPISAAQRGKLSILDGAVNQNFDLGSGQLKKGAYTYKPRTDDVTIRLQLEGLPADQNAFGVTRILGARRMGTPASR